MPSVLSLITVEGSPAPRQPRTRRDGPALRATLLRDADNGQQLLSLLFQLTKTMKSKGVVALESHIEKPSESTIFQKFPKVLKDHFAVDFICDTLRMMTMNLEDPHQVEDAMEKQLEKHHHEHLEAAHALQNLADGLPALGIVAARLHPDRCALHGPGPAALGAAVHGGMEVRQG